MPIQDSSSSQPNKALFDFVNFDSKTIDQDQLLVFAKKYVDYAYQGDEAKEKFRYFSDATFDEDDDNEFQKRVRLLKGLQIKLRELLDSIMASKEQPFEIKQQGTRTIKFSDDEFVEVFESDRIDNQDMRPKAEKQNAESALVDMITNNQLQVRQFKKCDHCGNYFYHAKMLFCSPSCGNAFRQKKWQQEQKKKKSKE